MTKEVKGNYVHSAGEGKLMLSYAIGNTKLELPCHYGIVNLLLQ